MCVYKYIHTHIVQKKKKKRVNRPEPTSKIGLFASVACRWYLRTDRQFRKIPTVPKP